jgi:hypothetical protein
MPESNPEHQKEQNSSEDGTYLLTPEQHRAEAKRLRQANKPQLALAHEQVAQAIERKSRTAVAKTPNADAVHRVAEKLALSQQNAEKWAKIAAKPGLSPQAAEWASNVARSSKAAADLYQKALAYESQNKAVALAQKHAEMWLEIAADPTLSPERALSARNIARRYQNKAQAYEGRNKAAAMTGKSAIPQTRAQVSGGQAPTPVNSQPKFQGGKLLLRAEQYRSMANQLRANPAPKAQELALDCENLAKIAEQRESAQPISQAGTFLMTPAQHRARAELLRKAGKDELARQYDLLATAIERRQSAPPISQAGTFQRTPEQAEAQVAALRKNASPQTQEQVAGDQALAPVMRSQGQAIEKQHASASALKAALPPFLEKGFRAVAEVAFFMLSVFVVLGFLHLIVTADPVWFLAALAFGGLIWFGKSRS